MDITGKDVLITAIEETVSELLDMMASIDESKINTVPYKDSWTAAQLSRHLTKSNYGMARAMCSKSKPADRDPGEKIAELKKTFLDFSRQLKSPDFVVPEEGPYEKQAAIAELNKSVKLLIENTNQADLTDLVDNLPLGPITKLEILHFVLYHLQRHLHQLKKISVALKNK
ncbi:MAG: hypothetical protein JWM28_1343 [Chitinophagaceae bacterium]|nr:hypothetical protein [Chitinophagaceae bacterium]